MNDAVALVILVLATWRVSSLVAIEDGPFYLFGRLRHRAGVRFDEYSNAYGITELAKGMLCVWCNSVWFGALWALLYWLVPGLALGLALPLALSAGAILIEQISGGIE